MRTATKPRPRAARQTNRARPPSTLKMAPRRALRQWWSFAPLSLAAGLLVLLVAHSHIENTYDDLATGRTLYFLFTVTSVLCVGTFGTPFPEGDKGARVLLASGMSRRRILAHQAWLSSIYAVGAAGVTLLTVIVLCTITGDFSGELQPSGKPAVDLWALPVLVMMGSVAVGWFSFAIVMMAYRYRWFLGLFLFPVVVLPTLFLPLLFGVDVGPNPPPAAAFVPFTDGLPFLMFPSVNMFGDNAFLLTTVLTLAVTAGNCLAGWLLLRRLPIRR